MLNYDDYRNRLPYGSDGSRERAAWNAETCRLEKKLREDLEIEEGTTTLPSIVRDALWEKAWSRGHASGYEEIGCVYADLAPLVWTAFKAGGHRLTRSGC